MLRKQTWIPSKKIGPMRDLKQHKIGGVIGSFWKRNLAGTSGKDGTIHRKKVCFGNFPIKEVIFEKPLGGGRKGGQLCVNKSYRSKL